MTLNHRYPLRLITSALFIFCFISFVGCEETSIQDPVDPAVTPSTGDILSDEIHGQTVLLGASVQDNIEKAKFYTKYNLMSKKELANKLRYEGIPIFQQGDDIRIIIPSDYIFETNSNIIRFPSRPILDQIAVFLNKYGDVPMVVAGYSDTMGTKAQQYERSEAHANAVSGYLWGRGVDMGRMDVKYFGAKDPIGNNDTATGSAANRRVEIRFRQKPFALWWL